MKPESSEQQTTPPVHPADEHPELSARNARTGLLLFAVYLVFYGGFMGLNAFNPQLMAKRPFGGVNLAILYGIGLILGAVALALLYMYLCRRAAADHASEVAGK